MDMIGKKNRLITFCTYTTAVDGANEPVNTDCVTVKQKWAEIKGESGMGSIRAAAMAGDLVNTPLARYSYRVNYDTSITAAMHIHDSDGVALRIIGVRHDKANREWTDVIAEEGSHG